MTAEEQKMIPLSVVDAAIKELEELQPKDREQWDTSHEWRASLIHSLKEIKKEATLEPMEQKIKDRIKELELLLFAEPSIKFPDYKYARIDELRKLLE